MLPRCSSDGRGARDTAIREVSAAVAAGGGGSCLIYAAPRSLAMSGFGDVQKCDAEFYVITGRWLTGGVFF